MDESKKSEVTDFSIEKITNEIIERFDIDKKIIRDRLDTFTSTFKTEFHDQTPFEHGQSAVIVWALLDTPLILFGMNMHSAALMEIHSILERFVIRHVVEILTKPKNQDISTKIIERLTLSDLAPILQNLNVLDNEDLKFIEKLSKLRNGVAHKNAKVISNVANSGKLIPVLDIESVVNKIDFIPIVIGTIKIFNKLMNNTMKSKSE